MWDHHARIFLRQLLKYRVTYGINLAGLAVGIACCVVCFLHIRFETSYDTFHPSGNRLFRITNGDPATTESWVKTAAPIPPKIKAEIPEVEGFVRFNSVTYAEKAAVEYGDKVLLEPYFMMADTNFFDVFAFPMREGSTSALQDLNSVLISISAANRMFGSESPVGKTIRLREQKLDFVISGIFEDLPVNTHLRCDYLISFENLDRIFGKGSSEAWEQNNYFAYLLLHPASDVTTVTEKIRSIQVQRPDEEALSLSSTYLQPITRIHFESNRGNILPSYDERYLYMLATLAFSVLVICLMNYVNSSAMISLRRFKEIGVRKSVGATLFQLNRQFLTESLAMVCFSILLATLLLVVSAPTLSSLLGSPIEIPKEKLPFLAFVAGVSLVLVLASAIHLTTYVNRLRPGDVLKGITPSSGQGHSLQHTLLFLQFTLSLILLLGAYVVVQQMRHMQNKNLGFTKDQVIQVTIPRGIEPSVLSAMRANPVLSGLIESSSFADFAPGRPNWNNTTWWEGQAEPEYMNIIVTDREFIKTLQIELLEGNIDEIAGAKELQFIINESARNHIGWTEAKGKFLSPFGETQKRAVAGVVKDFNFRSLHNPIAPVILAVYPERSFNKWYVRLNGGDVREGLAAIRQAYEAAVPAMPFEFDFLDDAINRLYLAEIRMEKIIVLVTIVSVTFALLGILTLLSFSIEYRTREIAIRKVLGITLHGLVRLFVGSYLKLVLLAGIVAVPICWQLSSGWLSRFNDRSNPQLLVFILVVAILGILVGGIGFLKYLALHRVNPAAALKRD